MALDKIQTLLDSKDTSPRVRYYLEIISEAMNDWPTDIESFENYINQIESFVTGRNNKKTCMSDINKRYHRCYRLENRQNTIAFHLREHSN